MASDFRFIFQFRKLYKCWAILQYKCSSVHTFARRTPPFYILFQSRAEKIIARFSTTATDAESCFSGPHLSKLQNKFVPGNELFSIIKSACHDLEGPSHRWLNNSFNDNIISSNGVLLILVNAFIQDDSSFSYHDRIFTIETMKLMQKRYPKLNVIGLQCVCSSKSKVTHLETLKTIMEEYISFPILLLDRNLYEASDSSIYLFNEGATSHPFFMKAGAADMEFIKKAIDELSLLKNENMAEKLNGNKANQHASIVEPYACAYFRSLFLYHPDSLSVDEDGGHIFLSDNNQHRIIVTDTDGKILDLIGSSPGFVDADFESAKLLRPAASFYNVSEGCLYFVDSENSAIRRADMTRKLVETMYPIPKSNGVLDRVSHLCRKIIYYFGLEKEQAETEELCFDQISSPWHMLELVDDELLIISRSFAIAWIINKTTWKLKKVIRGFQNIFESCENSILNKNSSLRDAYATLPPKFCVPFSSEKLFCARMMSSIGNLHDDIIIYDAAAQSLLKFNRKSMQASHIPFLNVGFLGVPYWLSTPIERVFNSNYACKQAFEHVHSFIVLPGRCNIRVNVEIPKDAVLAAPLDESCIWRHARGSATELSVFGEDDLADEKVGVAQQWFDELDNLAFDNSEVKSMESGRVVDTKSIDKSFQETREVHFNCVANVSPGTSEVIVSAALYLKPNPALSLKEAANLLNFQNKIIERELFNLFLEKFRNISDIIFIRPLHIRIKLDCGDHPAATTSKETILTDSRVELSLAVE